MENNLPKNQIVRNRVEKEVNARKLLNILGIFIFGGLALTNLTNPIPVNEVKEFMLFIFGSTTIYYLLVNIYFFGHIGRKIVMLMLLLLTCFSLFMVYYLLKNPLIH